MFNKDVTILTVPEARPLIKTEDIKKLVKIRMKAHFLPASFYKLLLETMVLN